MIYRLRLQLTVWFVVLVMLVFAADSALEIVTFHHRLQTEITENLVRLCSELVPDVQLESGLPTMRRWGTIIEQKHLLPKASIQLFDRSGKLLEHYGGPGIPLLSSGRLEASPANTATAYFSAFTRTTNDSYVEVQVSCAEHDAAVSAFAWNKLWRGLIISIAIGICGWIYSGKAVQPVLKSLKTLRKFVDDAGHELKTPVTVIQGSIQLLEADMKADGQALDLLQIMSRASGRLSSLSTNLLLLAKMDNPDVTLRKLPVDVKEIVISVISDLAETAATKGLHIQLRPLPSVIVIADREALSRLFSNLLDNAIRYTAPGGNITVSGIHTEHAIAITVEDTGIGIPLECIDHVFDRFFRVDQARSREAGGSGLGLAIAKTTADVHGGNITVESELGVGSKFTVTLPVSFKAHHSMMAGSRA